MIKSQFLRKQQDKSRRDLRTASFIRRITLLVVDRSLREHYGDNYSIRCLQASAGITQVLRHFGISAKPVLGEVCVPGVFVDQGRTRSTWSGFWGNDHHVWTVTEFHELVDLSIGQLHIHPASSGPGGQPMPPLWWNDPDCLPSVVHYLPSGQASIRLPADEQRDMEVFLNLVGSILDYVVGHGTVDGIVFGPIMEDIASLEALSNSRDAWALGALGIQESGVQLPERVRERHEQLLREWEGRQARKQ